MKVIRIIFLKIKIELNKIHLSLLPSSILEAQMVLCINHHKYCVFYFRSIAGIEKAVH